MNGLLLAGLLIPCLQYAENVTCAQKIKNVVFAVCEKMPSRKTCLIAFSAAASTAMAIGIALKYTDILSKIFVKNAIENQVEKDTDNSNDAINIDDVVSNNQSDKVEDTTKTSDEKKLVEAKGFFGIAREWISSIFDNQAV